MEALVALLREKGYKITPQRRAVIAALMESEKFPTAQQILEIVKKTNPDMSLDTVYRNLALLVELKVVYEINTQNSAGNVYEIAKLQHQHHHHVVCLVCGKTECIDLCPVNEAYIAEAEKRGFEITGHTFEFYGKCHACRNLSDA
ncbi:Fur family transcriptional regulator [Anaerosinus massiliensis]|uniref:Fur family transcriptional regulator n=1 Tax=Massilibacillus massiliensis TaxID=1806837 RepID=UPI000A82C987|nr:Fur family transcriptional regulator [Massilibacillus massiliensis]